LSVSLSDCCRLLKFRPHRFALPRHVQLGKYINGGSQLSPLRFAITLFAREKAPSPVAVSKTAPLAQLQAERFLFLVQRKMPVGAVYAVGRDGGPLARSGKGDRSWVSQQNLDWEEGREESVAAARKDRLNWSLLSVMAGDGRRSAANVGQ